MEHFLFAVKTGFDVVWLLITLWGGYYLVTGLMSWRRPMDYGWHPARTRFAILIAARNEELVIGPLGHRPPHQQPAHPGLPRRPL